MGYSHLFRLDGKIALCVGVGGIGERVAAGLHDFGAVVVPGDIDAARAEAVARGLAGRHPKQTCSGVSRSERGTPGNLWVQLDITDPASIESALGRVIERHGRLDILVNMVGLNIFKDALEMSPSDYERVIAINLTGAWNLSKAAARIMIPQGSGKIIHTASITAFRGSPGQGVYAAAKAALVNMTKTLALEWIRKGVYVNAVSPVMTETPINADWLSAVPGRRQSIASRIPIGRLGTPEDFVGPVVFLASDASNFVVGQTIAVDGGTSVQHPLFGGA